MFLLFLLLLNVVVKAFGIVISYCFISANSQQGFDTCDVQGNQRQDCGVSLGGSC